MANVTQLQYTQLENIKAEIDNQLEKIRQKEDAADVEKELYAIYTQATKLRDYTEYLILKDGDNSEQQPQTVNKATKQRKSKSKRKTTKNKQPRQTS